MLCVHFHCKRKLYLSLHKPTLILYPELAAVNWGHAGKEGENKLICVYVIILKELIPK